MQGGNKRLKLMLKLVQFTGVHFPDLNSSSYDNLNNMKLDLSVFIYAETCRIRQTGDATKT